MFKNCWSCLKDNASIKCDKCSRVFHKKCISQSDNGKFQGIQGGCVECQISAQELAKWCSGQNSQRISKDQFNKLLGKIIEALRCKAPSQFLWPKSRFPDAPFDRITWSDIEAKIANEQYGCPYEWFKDFVTLRHNIIITHKNNEKVKETAKTFIMQVKKVCFDLKLCPYCVNNYYTDRGIWMTMTCPRGHALVFVRNDENQWRPAKLIKIYPKDRVAWVFFFGDFGSERARIENIRNPCKDDFQITETPSELRLALFEANEYYAAMKERFPGKMKLSVDPTPVNLSFSGFVDNEQADNSFNSCWDAVSCDKGEIDLDSPGSSQSASPKPLPSINLSYPIEQMQPKTTRSSDSTNLSPQIDALVQKQINLEDTFNQFMEEITKSKHLNLKPIELENDCANGISKISNYVDSTQRDRRNEELAYKNCLPSNMSLASIERCRNVLEVKLENINLHWQEKWKLREQELLDKFEAEKRLYERVIKNIEQKLRADFDKKLEKINLEWRDKLEDAVTKTRQIWFEHYEASLRKYANLKRSTQYETSQQGTYQGAHLDIGYRYSGEVSASDHELHRDDIDWSNSFPSKRVSLYYG